MHTRTMFNLLVSLMAFVAGCVTGTPAHAQQSEGRYKLPHNSGVMASEFGAVANDGIDDSDALNEAQVFASENDKGPVLLGGGRYNVSKTLLLYANGGLVGIGKETEIFLTANSGATTGGTLTDISTDLVAPTSFKPIITPLTTGGPHQGIVVANLTINGNGANQEDGHSYANITTYNSEGMLIDNIWSIDAKQDLTISGSDRAFCLLVWGRTSIPSTITNASWTDATKTLAQTGIGTGVSAGMRIRFTAGTGVYTGRDFPVASASANAIVLVDDLNAAAGNIASGVAGEVYNDGSVSGQSRNAKITNSYFDNAGYDCVSVRGAGTFNTSISNCTILRGQQYSVQIADRGSDTTITDCTLDNTGHAPADTGVGGGFAGHAARRAKLIDCRVLADCDSNCVNIFGDNNNTHSEVEPNYGEDCLVDRCTLIYSGVNSGISVADFNGAAAGYQYARRNTISNSLLICTDTTQTHACVIYGTDTTGGGLTLIGNTMWSYSNEACINLGASRNILVKSNRVINYYDGGFAAARALVISASAAATPQGVIVNDNYLANIDQDSPIVSIIGSVNIMFNDNVVGSLAATAPSVPALILDNADDTTCVGNEFLSGTSSTAGVVHIKNTPDRVCVANNRIRRGIGVATQPAYGIGCTGGTYIDIHGNDISLAGTAPWGTQDTAGGAAAFTLGVGSRVYGNLILAASTLKDANQGTATITSGNTTVTVTHNMVSPGTRGLRITDFTLTLAEDTTNTIGAFWIANVGATTFDIVCENDPGASNADFAWSGDISQP